MRSLRKRLINIFQITGFTLLAASCSLFEYHPYETNVRYHDLNRKAIDKLQESLSDADTISFIAIGDTQRFYDEVEDFVKSANRQNADFVVVNGDISDFGLKDEFAWIHERLKKLKVPYISVIGNHDLRGNGTGVFKEMYGPVDDAFTINRTKFISLNTNAREYNFSGHVPNIIWLQEQLSGDDFDHSIVISHVPPTDDDFDPDLSDAFIDALAASNKVTLSLHAHQHSFSEGTWYDETIPFLITTSMEERMYVLIKVYGGKFTYEKIYY